MPRVVDRAIAPIAASVLADDLAILADYDAIGIGMNLDWPTDRLGHHRVFVVVEANEAGLGYRGRTASRYRRIDQILQRDAPSPGAGLSRADGGMAPRLDRNRSRRS